jgi:hypothetical protein
MFMSPYYIINAISVYFVILIDLKHFKAFYFMSVYTKITKLVDYYFIKTLCLLFTMNYIDTPISMTFLHLQMALEATLYLCNESA